jgi:osmotically-inducible protein OsmY
MPAHAIKKETFMKSATAGMLLSLNLLLVPVWAHAADSSTDTTGEYLDDAGITAKVKAAFAADKVINGRNISVRTDQGVVDLTGTVSDSKVSEHVTDVATHVKAVKAVHNNLKIAGK